MCTPASTALFACPSGSDCVQVIPAYPPGGDTSAGSFGPFSNQYLVYEFPFCAMHI